MSKKRLRTATKEPNEAEEPTQKAKKAQDQRFKCEYPGCLKSFSRKDHLKRHKLNHDDNAALYECEECGMKFKRADVKKDHYNRHLRNKATEVEYNPQKPETPGENSTPNGAEFAISPFPMSGDISSFIPQNWTIGINDNLFSPVYGRSPESTKSRSKSFDTFYDFTDILTRPDLNFEQTLNSTLLELLESDLGNIPSFQGNSTLITSELMRRMLFLIPTLTSHEDFDATALELCLNIYWTTFHIQYPIIHKPSFNTLTAPPILILAMVLMGAALSNSIGNPFKDPLGMAMEIGIPLRWLIFKHRSPGASEPWEIQSLLILEVFEKHYSSRDLHERSSVHYAAKIEMMKRSTVLGGDPYATESKSHTELNETDQYVLWNKWIHAESMKRCALMAFCFDLNSLITSGHQASLYVNKLRLGLPCDDCLWEADIDTLKNLELPKNPEMVLTALKKLLKGEKVQTNSFGKKVMLFAVVSLMVQFELRDETMAMITDESTSDILKDVWRDKLSYALDSWKFNVNEGSCCDVSTLLVDLRVRKADSGTVYFDLNDTKCKYPSYHMAQIRLRIVNHDMLILAGLPLRMSVKVDDKDYKNVEMRLRKWAKSLDGRVSVVHAYLCVIECLLNFQDGVIDYRPDKDPVHERAHIINASVMIIWCYNFLERGPESDKFKEGLEEYNEDAFDYLVRIKEELDRNLVLDRGAFEYHMSIRKCAANLSSINNLNNLASFFNIVSSLYAQCFWELGVEYSRLHHHCKERFMGKQDPFCKDMYNFKL